MILVDFLTHSELIQLIELCIRVPSILFNHESGVEEFLVEKYVVESPGSKVGVENVLQPSGCMSRKASVVNSSITAGPFKISDPTLCLRYQGIPCALKILQ